MPARRLVAFVCVASALIVNQVQAQPRSRPPEQARLAPAPLPDTRRQTEPEAPKVRPGAIASAITLADLGFGNGFRFANLGGRREFFVPLPQGADITARELVLAIDDVSAHSARRSFEVLVNDHIVASIALDGRGQGRIVRIPLAQVRPREGFLKLSLLYSGAATQDRCIDVRYVGDSLTVRPESAVEIETVFPGGPDVATTASLMPRDVAIVLPGRRLEAHEIATALTVARVLAASGRRIAFHQGFDELPALARRDGERWTRAIVIVAALQEVAGHIDPPVATVAGPAPAFGALVAARIGGTPALVVSDASAVGAGRLLGSPLLNATRGVSAAFVGDIGAAKAANRQISLDRLGIVLPTAEVFGRAELAFALDTRMLPAGTKPARLILDLMVAPDGAGEKAVVSAFINERLIDSAVAAVGDETRLDLPLADGLIGTTASVRVVVQRRSAQGDCRFEPQGYPAQLLGSSAVVLETADIAAQDFSDLVAHWASGVDILVPPAAAERPLDALPLLAAALISLAPETAAFTVKLVAQASQTTAPFIAVSASPPQGTTPRVRFDRGRVVVADKSGNTLVDLR